MKITFNIAELESAISNAKHQDPAYEEGRSRSEITTIELEVNELGYWNPKKESKLFVPFGQIKRNECFMFDGSKFKRTRGHFAKRKMDNEEWSFEVHFDLKTSVFKM